MSGRPPNPNSYQGNHSGGQRYPGQRQQEPTHPWERHQSRGQNWQGWNQSYGPDGGYQGYGPDGPQGPYPQYGPPGQNQAPGFMGQRPPDALPQHSGWNQSYRPDGQYQGYGPGGPQGPYPQCGPPGQNQAPGFMSQGPPDALPQHAGWNQAYRPDGQNQGYGPGGPQGPYTQYGPPGQNQATGIMGQGPPAPLVRTYSSSPVIALKNMNTDVEYSFLSETSPFKVLVCFGGQEFKGVAKTKKAAKEEAAKQAMTQYYDMHYVPGRDKKDTKAKANQQESQEEKKENVSKKENQGKKKERKTSEESPEKSNQKTVDNLLSALSQLAGAKSEIPELGGFIADIRKDEGELKDAQGQKKTRRDVNTDGSKHTGQEISKSSGGTKSPINNKSLKQPNTQNNKSSNGDKGNLPHRETPEESNSANSASSVESKVPNNSSQKFKNPTPETTEKTPDPSVESKVPNSSPPKPKTPIHETREKTPAPSVESKLPNSSSPKSKPPTPESTEKAPAPSVESKLPNSSSPKSKPPTHESTEKTPVPSVESKLPNSSSPKSKHPTPETREKTPAPSVESKLPNSSSPKSKHPTPETTEKTPTPSVESKLPNSSSPKSKPPTPETTEKTQAPSVESKLPNSSSPKPPSTKPKTKDNTPPDDPLSPKTPFESVVTDLIGTFCIFKGRRQNLQMLVESLKEKHRTTHFLIHKKDGHDEKQVIIGYDTSIPKNKIIRVEPEDMEIEVFMKNPYHVSDEAASLNNLHLSGNRSKPDDEILEILHECIKENAPYLWRKHSNLTIITGDTIKAVNETPVLETCIVLYCLSKSYIPINEELFPKELSCRLGKIKTDVREGYFSLGPTNLKGDLDAYNDPICMGSNIGGSMRNASGSLGLFINLPNNEKGFITCCHVLFDCIKPKLFSYDKQSTDATQHVIQPGNSSFCGRTDTICGEIKLAKFCPNVSPVSIDAAIVKVNSRMPTTGHFVIKNVPQAKDLGFTRNALPLFDTGKVRRQLYGADLEKPLLKSGTSSGLTRSLFRLSGTQVRIFDNGVWLGIQGSEPIVMKGQYEVESGSIHNPFFITGDSGSAVFMKDPNGELACIGIAIGKTSYDTTVITPIGAVLDGLGLKDSDVTKFP